MNKTPEPAAQLVTVLATRGPGRFIVSAPQVGTVEAITSNRSARPGMTAVAIKTNSGWVLT